jgi:hypothetical protein
MVSGLLIDRRAPAIMQVRTSQETPVSLTLELPPDLAAALSDEAARQGLSLPEYAIRLLAAAPRTPTPVRTGSDLVAYWQAEGVAGSRPDVTDSQAHARDLRARAERRG